MQPPHPKGPGVLGDLGCQQHAEAYMMPMTHNPTPHWQQSGMHGGFAHGACPNDGQQVVWVQSQSTDMSMQSTRTQMSQQENTCQTLLQPESPSQASPQPVRRTISLEAVQHILQTLQLEVPKSVKTLQKELCEEQEQPQQEETRAEQLQRQLDLVQQMQQQLLAQAVETLNKRGYASLQQGLGQHQPWGCSDAGMPWVASDSMTGIPGSGDVPPQHFGGGTTPPMKQRSLHKVPVRPGTKRPPPSVFDGGTGGGGNGGTTEGPRCGTGSKVTPGQCNGQKPTTAAAAADAVCRGPPPDVADTMKTQLQALQQEDPETVFIARRINKLGFNSADQLRSHFATYGEVKCVHVSHSRVKSMRPDVQWRMRAASLGFVVMASAEATRNILRDSPEHVVNGVAIRVYEFHKLGCPQASEDEGGPLEADASRRSAAMAQPQPMNPGGVSSLESPLHFFPLSQVSKEELTKALPEYYED